VERLLSQECTESKDSILGSIGKLPQGVRAGVFLKTRVVEKSSKEFSALKYWKRRNNLVSLADKFCERYFIHFAKIVKEEFDGQNPPWRIREVPKAVRSHRGARELRQHSSSEISGE
jgi:hypothetical protein